MADLDLLLHHLWVVDQEIFTHERLRLYLALILVLAGATATRPRALIEGLHYEDVQFQVFPPTTCGGRSRLGMVVTLTNLKGESEPKEFGFHEEDTLLHDAILYMLSLAFADGAFENSLKRPEDIYTLVPYNSDRLSLPWKPEWRKRPVFRDVLGSRRNVIVALDKAFTYHKARKYLISLGRALGYEKQLEWYDLRRGSGQKLNGMWPYYDL